MSAIASVRVLGVLGCALCIGIAGVPASRVQAQAVAASAACDRACLDGVMDRYLAALINHDPSQLPHTRNVRFTENGVALVLGDGLWGTASGLGKFKQYFEDVAQGEAGYFGTIREHGRPAREVPFSPQCNRWNNGELTTNAPHTSKILEMGCAEQFNSRFLVFVTRIRRRFPLVDVDRGVVLASGFFDHAGRLRSVKLSDGTTMEVPVTHQEPKTLALMEAFKIVDGRIRRIDAIEGFVTYGLCSGWDGDRCPTAVR